MTYEIVEKQRAYFLAQHTKTYAFRRDALLRLRRAIESNQENILEALRLDLNKPAIEGYMVEYAMVIDEINYILRHLRRWMKPKKVPTSLIHFPAKSRILSEPYGVVLIMSPWNYPFQLTLEPLAGAIAAGNCAVIKPSNSTPNTSKLIAEIIHETFDPSYIEVVQGGRKENADLLEEHFDYIFFTGSVSVGKVVMEAASKHLTPVSLELGGKSPCIVDKSANLKLAAKRIVFGKYMNSGLTCVAPDYLFVHTDVKEALIKLMIDTVEQFYPHGDYSTMSSIVTNEHFQRIMALVKDEKVRLGGSGDARTRIISPTILDEITWESRVMQEEIFGPVLPIMAFQNLEDVIEQLHSRAKPLSLYLFANDKEIENKVLSSISFGGGCVNDTIVHVASSTLGFGGVGDSGMGSYHGYRSFNTFSHEKSVLMRGGWLDPTIRYRPYTDFKSKLIKMLMG